MGSVSYDLYVVVEFTEGYFSDKFGLMFAKYSLKLFAISISCICYGFIFINKFSW